MIAALMYILSFSYSLLVSPSCVIPVSITVSNIIFPFQSRRVLWVCEILFDSKQILLPGVRELQVLTYYLVLFIGIILITSLNNIYFLK